MRAAGSQHPNRILVLLPDASNTGGVRVAGELVREWMRTGIDVQSISLTSTSTVGREILGGAPHEALNASSSFSRLRAVYRILTTARPSFDIIFAIGDYSSIIAFLAALALLRNRRPLVVNADHSPLPLAAAIEQSKRTKAVRWIVVRGVQSVLRRLDGVIFLSQSQMIDPVRLSAYGRVEATVIRNPVRFGVASSIQVQQRTQRLEVGDPIRLVSVGSLNARKNHSLLVAALLRLPSQFKLSIVGSGELEGDILAQIVRLDLFERVQLLGAREDVAEIMDCSDIFVMSSNQEASPLVYLEAMVRGLPVVTTDCAPDCGILAKAWPSFAVVPRNDPEAFSVAVAAVAARTKR